MSERHKTQSLRPVEVLIVLVMLLFLLAVVPVACRRVRSTDYQSTCATNLSSLGRAMLIYANDYDDKLPRSGGRESVWSSLIPNWKAFNRFEAYGMSSSGKGGVGSISSCLYLLVKYTEVTPKTFICPQDKGTSEFKPSNEGAVNIDLIDLWDFGADPFDNCSYSYHMPFCKYALELSSEPGMAVAADKNPFMPSLMAEPKNFMRFQPEGSREAIKAGNAHQHDDEGQNVLFLDSHVSFEKKSYCGVRDDNIYTFWDGGDIRRGALPTHAGSPQDRTDSFLVHDYPSGRPSSDPPVKGRACFLADTPVWIEGTLEPISDVIEGQTMCRSACETPGLWPNRVEKVQEHTGTFVCRDVVLENANKIGVVGSHCFMLASGKWIAAQNLTSRMSLRTLKGAVGIKSVTVRPTAYTGNVYNLKIKNSDTYAVGKDAIIVRDF